MRSARAVAVICAMAPSAAACGLILGLQPTGAGASSDASGGGEGEIDAEATVDHSAPDASVGAPDAGDGGDAGDVVVERTIFVTSTVYTGNLGGLSGADQRCQMHARDAGLRGTYKAWLSDSVKSAADRFLRSAVPYQLVNGARVADDWNGLVGGTLRHEINRTEDGGSPPPSVGTDGFCAPSVGLFWTGTEEDGGRIPSSALCSDWTSADPNSGPPGSCLGNAGNTTGWSANCIGAPCSAAASLVCVQQ